MIDPPGMEVERDPAGAGAPGSLEERHSLLDLVNRLLDKGVVLTGEITIAVAGVDLVHLGLNAVLTSISTARSHLDRPVGEIEAEAAERGTEGLGKADVPGGE